MSDQSWKQVAEAKAQSVLDQIPREWRLLHIPSISEEPDISSSFMHKHLTPREIEITETDAVEIVKNTSSGHWTAVEVMKAFCHRAAIAHQVVSCLHEVRFEPAIWEAQASDMFLAKHGKPMGPLHGLPVSLKDQFHVSGLETHMGYVGWIGTYQGVRGTGKEKVVESELVRELRSLGAVIFCKTSVPHTLMCGETINNIIGYTQNSKNRNLSSGGSSGGEGTLIGARGSPLGFGTDIGGSVRIPSAFNGLFGLRPSAGRIAYEGAANSMDGQGSVLSVVGPMATTAGALKLALQSLLSTKPWLYDPTVHEIPWRPELEAVVADPIQRRDNGLNFGVIRHDGITCPFPPVLRAIDIITKALTTAGHEVIDWKAEPSIAALSDICNRAFVLDGSRDLKAAFALSGESPAPQILMADTEEKTASDIMELNVHKRNLQKQYMDYWNDSGNLTANGRPVDAIICPVAPFPAAMPGKYTQYEYTFWVNTLDYTSVVIPVTTVDKSFDLQSEDFKPCSKSDASTQAIYDPEIYHGAHVGLQLVGRRLQEEKMIAIAKYVSDLLGT